MLCYCRGGSHGVPPQLTMTGIDRVMSFLFTFTSSIRFLTYLYVLVSRHVQTMRSHHTLSHPSLQPGSHRLPPFKIKACQSNPESRQFNACQDSLCLDSPPFPPPQCPGTLLPSSSTITNQCNSLHLAIKYNTMPSFTPRLDASMSQIEKVSFPRQGPIGPSKSGRSGNVRDQPVGIGGQPGFHN